MRDRLEQFLVDRSAVSGLAGFRTGEAGRLGVEHPRTNMDTFWTPLFALADKLLISLARPTGIEPVFPP